MEFRYLEEFVDLAQTLNFTQTAATFNVTQPTLSKHISALEHDLDATLFKRQPNEVTLTEEGFCFLGSAASILDQYKAAREALALIKSRTPIRVDGRTDDSVIMSLLSITASTAATRGLPPVTFNHDRSKDTLTLLEQGDLDLIVDSPPARARMREGMRSVPILRRGISIVVRADHPLAQRSELEFNDLSDQLFIQMINESFESAWEHIEECCRNRGFEPQKKPAAVNSMLEGVASLDERSVLFFPSQAKELKYLKLAGSHQCIPLVGEGAYFPIHAIYLQENEKRIAPLLSALDEVMATMQLER